MPVGNDDRPYLMFAVLKVLGVWQDIVNARRVRLFELKSHINHDDVILIFNDRHIAPDLFNAPKRDDTNTIADVRYDIFLFCRRFRIQ